MDHLWSRLGIRGSNPEITGTGHSYKAADRGSRGNRSPQLSPQGQFSFCQPRMAAIASTTIRENEWESPCGIKAKGNGMRRAEGASNQKLCQMRIGSPHLDEHCRSHKDARQRQRPGRCQISIAGRDRCGLPHEELRPRKLRHRSRAAGVPRNRFLASRPAQENDSQRPLRSIEHTTISIVGIDHATAYIPQANHVRPGLDRPWMDSRSCTPT